jgi:uncharacterized protein YbjT (DUF2867 family)
MRVFVTGASGWIGSAVVPELLSHGHDVLGLARADVAAEKVAAFGAEVLRGDIQDIDVLRDGAEQADGVVHLALGLADRGVRSMALRFAPTVHGHGDNGFTAMIVAADRATGQGAYVGEGTNRRIGAPRGQRGGRRFARPRRRD